MKAVPISLWTGVLICLTAPAVSAQGQPESVRLAPLLKAYVAGAAGSSPINLTIRAGAMVSPSGNALVGFDFPIPGVSFLTGWNARIDADFILAKETAVPVTFDVLQSGPLNKVYFGAGLGMI